MRDILESVQVYHMLRPLVRSFGWQSISLANMVAGDI